MKKDHVLNRLVIYQDLFLFQYFCWKTKTKKQNAITVMRDSVLDMTKVSDLYLK